MTEGKDSVQNTPLDKKKFLRGILFVIVGYLCIKLVDEYRLLFQYLKIFLGMISPILTGFIFAYMLNPVILFFERKTKMKRPRCIALVYLLLIAFLAVNVSVIFPKIYSSAVDLLNNIPYYFEQISIWLNNSEINFNIFDPSVLETISNEIISFLPKLGEIASSFIGSFIAKVITFGSAAFNTFISLVLCYYILLEKDKFCIYARKLSLVLFGKIRGTKVIELTGMLHRNIGKYLIGKTLDSVFVGLCALVGLYFLGSKYVLLFGILFGITNMVPYFGPIVSTAIISIINLFFDPKIAFFVFLYLVVVQQVETLVIDPKVVGKQLGLSPFFTLVSVSIGGKLFGVFGMILAVPVTAILKKVVISWINHKYEAVEDAPKGERN